MSNDIHIVVGKAEEAGQPEIDPELVQTVEHPPGFADLAGYLASDCERSIFKRFRWLTARNLLMMQDEITGLEEQIRRWDIEDRAAVESHDISPTSRLRSTLTSWDALVESSKTNSRDAAKMDVFMKLRNLLPAYQSALLAECQVLAIKSPPTRLLRDFKAFLKRKHGILTGPGRRFEDLRRFEFVSLDTEEDPDRMTDIVENLMEKININYFKDTRPEIPIS